MKIIINGRAFQDAAIFASTEEGRHYLHGVAVEPADEPGYVIAVATDGCRLVAIKAIGSIDPPEARPIINLQCLAVVKKAKNPWIVIEDRTAAVLDLGYNVEVTKPDEVPTATSSFAVASFPNSLIDGVFPEWRQSIPMTVDDGGGPIAPPAFNAAYLADFAKVSPPARSRRKVTRCIRIVPSSSNGPAWVFLPERPEFVGVLMPVRADEQSSRPAWLDAPKPIPVATEPPTDQVYVEEQVAIAAE